MVEKLRDKREKKAFEETALPFMHALYCAALHMSRVKEEAEALVQETYLLAYKNFDGFQRGTNCKAWLFKILRNVFINRYRKKIRSPETVHYDDIENYYLYNQLTARHDTLPPGFYKDPARLAEIIGEDVGAALQGIPDEFREVIILSDIEGFTYEEISRITDAPLGTVKSRLNRARRLLQKKLWDYAVTEGFIGK